ncbi:hypothetical protein AOR_1_1188084 [Paecilomyces variotii No. 5]|uniref:Rhodopsin domain-containing protein n=1 Tax=Byssochlamys spectabilis (strain No. 5 / NBRC 109023) TaxID=1356009 RepID=V5FW21_BYSSN|nr:hypothetical protein AOR_1_1188084 [Paecilomyces variotii No. 5]
MARNPDGAKANIVLWLATAVSFLVLLLRFYCKFFISRRLGWDDWVVFTSWILLTVYAALISAAVPHGLGRHLQDLLKQSPPANVALAMEYVLLGEFVAIIGCSLSKTSFAFTLLRIVVEKWQKIFLWFIIVSMNAVMMSCALLYLLRCTPVQANWDTSIHGKCFSIRTANSYAIFAGIYSGIMDFVLATLPWKILWKLQMKRREKFGCGLAMSLGFFASISAFVKTSYLPYLNNTFDITYYSVNLLIWAGAETGVTIIAVSLPPLRALFTRIRSSHGDSGGRDTDGYNLRSRKSRADGVFSGNHHSRATSFVVLKDDPSDFGGNNGELEVSKRCSHGQGVIIKRTEEVTISNFSEQPTKIIVGMLNARMTGAWANNDDKPLDWSNFDETTVQCVVSYLYIEDYYVPEQGSGIEEPFSARPDNKADIVERGSQSDDKLKGPLTPLDKCLQPGLPVKTRPTAAGEFDHLSKGRKEALGMEILTHAKVYIFAHYFMINGLEHLALQRFTQVLATVNDGEIQCLFPQLAEAIHVVYGGTLKREQHQDPARKLLSQFIALRHDLFSCEDFYVLLAQGGEFSIDVTRKLVRRIASADDVHKSLSERLSENTERLQEAQEKINGWEKWNSGLELYYRRRNYDR